MTSEPTEAFVWIWLPHSDQPVVCGRLDARQEPYTFTYGRSYLARPDAVPIFERELPLRSGLHTSTSGPRLPLCIDDAMPDSWGRQVIQFRRGEPTAEFGELTYLLESGSDRVGALDFQASSTTYVPRESTNPTLDDLYAASEAVNESDDSVDRRLVDVLLNGTLMGGARPKAVLTVDGRPMIAKFSKSTDTFPWVQSEYVAMELARRAGVRVAPVEITAVGDRLALLVERFDRYGNTFRRRVVSALTVLGFNTFPDGRYATYAGLAHQIRNQFQSPDFELRELYARISFNILCGNTDDHGRNHAAFVEEAGLVLTPAYDISPQPRTGRTASQAMAYTDDLADRDSRVAALVTAAGIYHLDAVEGQEIVDQQVDVIRQNWDDVCDAAHLARAERSSLLPLQFLNPHAFT